MFKNYFKIAWRSMVRQKLYASINILGLAVGLTCFILTFLYVNHEFSYDWFYPNAEQIYRVYQRQAGNMYLGTDFFAVTPAGLPNAMVAELPEVIAATSVGQQRALLSQDETSYYEQGLWADVNFFEVFPFTFVAGDPKTALAAAKQIVLTESMAQKIFGERNPIGQTLVYQNRDPFTITGVIKDPPTNSSLRFSFISSILSNSDYVRDVNKEKWEGNSYLSFFTIAENTDPKAVERKLSAVYDKYIGYDDTYPFQDTYYVQALSDLHLETNANFDIGLKGNPKYVRLFSLIAVIVLLLACVNYTNLAIARSLKRAREVGLRKTVGASRRQLIGQFIGESILVASLALLLALGLVQLFAPFFGYLLERQIELDLYNNLWLIPGLLLLVVVVGVIAGSYPAFVMASLRPAHILKGKTTGRFSKMNLQRWLVVGQYATSIVLVISSMIIYRQFQFIQNKELGFNTDHIVTVPISFRDDNVLDNIDVLKSELMRHPQILAVATSQDLPTSIESSTIINDRDRSNREDDLAIYRATVDYDFLDVFGIELLAGRNFSADIQTDIEAGYILNETAARAMGWTAEEAIGQQFEHQGQETIIGVVKDFHMHSMHMAIEPLMLHLRQRFFRYLSVRVRPENMSEALAVIEASVKAYSPYPFQYNFLDERFDQLYKADFRLGEIFGFFTILSILVASLGLFGLAAFTAGQRTKEVGIRKVLGATTQSIVTMLSRDFLTMVLIGFLVAIPIAWYVMNRWLQSFAYRVDIEWGIIVLAGLLAIIIAFFSVTTQSFKAALANPVDALKNE